LQKVLQNVRTLGLKIRLPVKELLPDLLREAHLNADKLNSKVSKNA